jgi:DNA polymerase
MPHIFWDAETRSTAALDAVGAWRYAGDTATEILCIAYAVDDADPQIWTSGQPVPTPFLEAARDLNWIVVAHNDQFERAIETRVLHPRYGWPLIPLAQRRCSMTMALACALPGSLEGAVAALGLPVSKDKAGHKLMLEMSKPRRRKKSEPAGIYWYDAAERREKLAMYCKRDVEVERALFRRLPLLSPAEQRLWELDAVINERGFHVDLELAKAARGIATKERIAINTEISALTDGEITTVDQVAKITTFVERNGHSLSGLTKRSVAAVLAHAPGDVVRRVLELRREGARASTRKLDRLLASVDADSRLRGTLRFHAASTGRWSGRQFQPQNLKKPETKDLDGAIDAILAGDLERVRVLGAPMTVTGDVSRAIICAAPGHVLIGADFSAIESRVLAWLAGETWKLETYRDYDATGRPELEPYCATASKILKRTVTPEDDAGRQLGKVADLAFGYGGGRGAWRKFDPSDAYSDADVEHFKAEWRRQHAATVRLWHALERAAHRTIHTGTSVKLDRIAFAMDNKTLLMVLPSGRQLAYPEACLVEGKFEGTREIQFKDNAKGGWTDRGAWYGTLVENAVQAISRDLLATAILGIDAADYPIVLTVHDEIVCEVPKGFGSEAQFLEIMTALPDWAAGLPIVAKPWSGKRYVKTASRQAEAATKSTPEPEKIPNLPEKQPEDGVSPLVTTEIGTSRTAAAEINESLIGKNVRCPFHDDSTPSMHLYDDHFHCFGCGARGDHVDLLMMAEGLTRDEALERLKTWNGSLATRPKTNDDAEAEALAYAMKLWNAAKPIVGTIAERYLADTRGIDLNGLPFNVDAILRFHPRCTFGSGTKHPCLIALLQNLTDHAPVGIQRVALTADAQKIERRMLGRWGAVMFWPPRSQLVIGEGIETVLAAATRKLYRGEPLRPAWSVISSGALGKFPILPGVERLIILVDNDACGKAAAAECAERWQRAGRTVIRLTPKRAGADFNDIIKAKHSHELRF